MTDDGKKLDRIFSSSPDCLAPRIAHDDELLKRMKAPEHRACLGSREP